MSSDDTKPAGEFPALDVNKPQWRHLDGRRWTNENNRPVGLRSDARDDYRTREDWKNV